MKLRNLSLVAVALLAYMAPSAKAGFVDTVSNGLNGYHDASFQFVNMANTAVGIQVGDTIIGFNQINIKESPGSVGTLNTIYTAFSETISAISANGQVLTESPTPATNPLSLQSILAGTGLTIPTGTLAMLFDTQSATQATQNLINNPPPAGTNMQSYLQFIAGATSGLKYDAALGFTTGDNSNLSTTLGTVGGNQVVANTSYVVGTDVAATAALFNTTPESVRSLATFTGGLSVLLNNTNVIFNNNVLGNDLKDHQVVLSNGVVGGGATNPNYGTWGTPGFEDSADIYLNATLIPEPSSIVLMALGMSGLIGLGYRRRKKAALAT